MSERQSYVGVEIEEWAALYRRTRDARKVATKEDVVEKLVSDALLHGWTIERTIKAIREEWAMRLHEEADRMNRQWNPK